jgi:FKBP-type peptidyl-prolyl cis-trans isomerase SlyD
MTELLKVHDGQVISMQYTLHVDGELVDASTESEPLQFMQGMGHILPGLERALYDLRLGDQKTVAVPPRDGYGEVLDEAYMEVPREAFPSDVPLQTGTELELQDQSGHPVLARVAAITDKAVRLNMNHPLAGKHLVFDVRITGIRPATEDEVSNGHVHSEAAAGHDM